MPHHRVWYFGKRNPGVQHGRKAAATTRSNADQGRGKRAPGPLQQSNDDSSQRGRVYAEFCLHLSEWSTGQAPQQHDRESGTRQADLAGPWRKYLTLRSAVWNDQGSTGRNAHANRWLRSVDSNERFIDIFQESRALVDLRNDHLPVRACSKPRSPDYNSASGNPSPSRPSQDKKIARKFENWWG